MKYPSSPLRSFRGGKAGDGNRTRISGLEGRRISLYTTPARSESGDEPNPDFANLASFRFSVQRRRQTSAGEIQSAASTRRLRAGVFPHRALVGLGIRSRTYVPPNPRLPRGRPSPRACAEGFVSPQGLPNCSVFPPAATEAAESAPVARGDSGLTCSGDGAHRPNEFPFRRLGRESCAFRRPAFRKFRPSDAEAPLFRSANARGKRTDKDIMSVFPSWSRKKSASSGKIAGAGVEPAEAGL